jgi:hypothetical protein
VLGSVKHDRRREDKRERESAAEGGREIEKEREHARVNFFCF